MGRGGTELPGGMVHAHELVARLVEQVPGGSLAVSCVMMSGDGAMSH